MPEAPGTGWTNKKSCNKQCCNPTKKKTKDTKKTKGTKTPSTKKK